MNEIVTEKPLEAPNTFHGKANELGHFDIVVRKRKTPWSGIQRFTSTSLSIQPALDCITGKLLTGIHDGEQIVIALPNGVKVNKYLKQVYYERLLGFETGKLDPDSIFWKEFSYKISDHTEKLNAHNPREALVLEVLSANKLIVARTNKEVREETEFFLFNKEQAHKDKVIDLDLKVEAFTLYADMTTVDKKNFLLSVGEVGIETLTDSAIKSRVGIAVESDPRSFITTITDVFFERKVWINRAVDLNIIKKKQDNYFYEDILLGAGLTGACQYFDKQIDTNKHLKMVIEEKMAAKGFSNWGSTLKAKIDKSESLLSLNKVVPEKIALNPDEHLKIGFDVETNQYKKDFVKESNSDNEKVVSLDISGGFNKQDENVNKKK